VERDRVDTIIQTDTLTKRFGSTRGVEDVSMSAQRGEVFGFLGPKRRRQDDDDSQPAGSPAPDERQRAAVRPRQPARQHGRRRSGRCSSSDATSSADAV
jgi:hypothetical protein